MTGGRGPAPRDPRKPAGSASGAGSSSGQAAGAGPAPRDRKIDPLDAARRAPEREDRAPRRKMTRIGDLLPQAAREFGLEDELELANAAAAWLRLIAERVPAAAGECRLIGLSQGVATVQADEAIVAQEIRLRTPELLAALRGATPNPIRQLRVSLRHV